MNAVEIKELTQEEKLVENLKGFAGLSSTLVGTENTNQVLNLLNQLIVKNPDFYQKIFDPKRQEKILKLASEVSEKGDFNIMTAVAYAPKIMKIFK